MPPIGGTAWYCLWAALHSAAGSGGDMAPSIDGTIWPPDRAAQNGGGGVAPAEWRAQRTPNGALSLPGLGRAGLRPAVAGRRAVRRNSAGYHAGRGGRWTAGRIRPPPGLRRRHACTPGRWPRRVWCLLEWCRRWTARFRAADGWQEWCCLSAAPAGRPAIAGRQGGGDGRALSGPCGDAGAPFHAVRQTPDGCGRADR